MNVFYLHGFASSARSRKAAFLAERFASRGIALRCPDFNEPEFSSLTVTRMLDRLAREIANVDREPVVLIGSSLGAVVAIHTAARLAERIDRLVLLAPAVMFPKDADRVLGADRVAEWRQSGTLDVLHHGDGVTRPLNYAFYEDGLRYDATTAIVTQPTRVFQGLRDEAVDHRIVEQWAAPRPNVHLTLLDDDHQLHASLPVIWSEMTAFLGVA
jgi:pimeloyl-ACP methyl ester carboxylesterase